MSCSELTAQANAAHRPAPSSTWNRRLAARAGGRGTATLGILATLLPLLFAAPAAAQDDRLSRAREHFERGKEWFAERQYDQALDELMKAFVLDPNPELVYNIARVHEEKNDLDNAVKYFENFVRIAPKARNTPAVKRKIRELKALIKRRPKPGWLSVSTEPAGATIRVDGRVVGQSPLSNLALQPGRYRVELGKDGFKPHRAELLVDSGLTTTLSRTLEDEPTGVFVATVPPGATAVLIRPEPRNLGTCPCVVDLPAGTYGLQASAPGYQTRELQFVKEPGQKLTLEVTLVPVETMGQLLVEASVDGAEVRVDGTALGQTPLREPIALRPGFVLVTVVAPGHAPWRGRAEIKVGETTRLHAFLDPQARPDAIVYRDDSQRPAGLRPAGWGLLGTGIGLLVGGAIMTTLAHVDQHAYDSGTYRKVTDQQAREVLLRQDMTHAQAYDLRDRAELYQTLSIVGYSVGGAALVTGIILLAADGGDDGGAMASSGTGIAVVPGGALLQIGVPLP